MPTHQLKSDLSIPYTGFKQINNDFYLNPNFDWGPKPAIPAKHINRTRPYPLAPVKPRPDLTPLFRSPSLPLLGSLATLVISTTFDMNGTMQDGINPDAHLRTQGVERPSRETTQDNVMIGKTLHTPSVSSHSDKYSA